MKVLKYLQKVIFFLFFGYYAANCDLFRQSGLKLHCIESTSNFHSSPGLLGKERGFLEVLICSAPHTPPSLASKVSSPSRSENDWRDFEDISLREKVNLSFRFKIIFSVYISSTVTVRITGIWGDLVVSIGFPFPVD